MSGHRKTAEHSWQCMRCLCRPGSQGGFVRVVLCQLGGLSACSGVFGRSREERSPRPAPYRFVLGVLGCFSFCFCWTEWYSRDRVLHYVHPVGSGRLEQQTRWMQGLANLGESRRATLGWPGWPGWPGWTRQLRPYHQTAHHRAPDLLPPRRQWLSGGSDDSTGSCLQDDGWVLGGGQRRFSLADGPK